MWLLIPGRVLKLIKVKSLHQATYMSHILGISHQILLSKALRDYKYLYSPLDRILDHHRVIPLPHHPCIKFTSMHLYTWVGRSTVSEVSCPKATT